MSLGIEMCSGIMIGKEQLQYCARRDVAFRVTSDNQIELNPTTPSIGTDFQLYTIIIYMYEYQYVYDKVMYIKKR